MLHCGGGRVKPAHLPARGARASCPGGGLMQGAAMARRTHLPRTLCILMLVPLMAGCTLIDQRTFDPRAGMGPETTGPGPTLPLITIDFDQANPVYETQLREAVDAAVARKPTVSFDVITLVPAVGTPTQQADAAAGIRANARDVARIIADQGTDVDRIHLLARSDAGVSGRQIQVFVH
jgi:hypothetical protein